MSRVFGFGLLLGLWLLASQAQAQCPGPATPEPFAAVAQRRVREVQIRVPRPLRRSELRPLIDIEPGSRLDPDALRASLVRLYSLGRFAQAEVLLLPPPPGDPSQDVGLLFVLTPKTRLRRLRLGGELGVRQEALLRAVGLQRGDEVDDRSALELQQRASTYLQQSGFPAAKVRLVTQGLTLGGDVDWCLQIEAGPPRRIGALRFGGTPRLPAAVLADSIASAIVQPLDLLRLQEDRRRLQQLYVAHGFWRAKVAPPRLRPRPDRRVDVQIDIDAGLRLAFDFAGNQRLTAPQLQQLITTDQVLSLGARLQLWRQAIVDAYARVGYPDARVALGQVRLPGGRAALAVRIDEGLPLQVTEIDIRGNSALPSYVLQQQCRALLRRELGDDEAFDSLRPFEQRHGSATPYRPLPAAGARHVEVTQRYVPELYQAAAEQIAAAYRDMGYLQVHVGAPVLHRQPLRHSDARITGARLSLQIDEGPQTRIDALIFAGNQAVPAAELLQTTEAVTGQRSVALPLLPGAALSLGGLEDARIGLVRAYRNQGFLYAQIDVEVVPRAEPLRAAVRFRIDEGPQVRVERSLLRGNNFTRDGVIRSRISLQPHDIYRLEEAVADQRRIAELGVFNSVRVRLLDEERVAARKDLIAEVRERRRQPIDIAPGISTAEGPRLRLGYSHLNVAGTATAFSASFKVNRQIFFDLFGDYAATLRSRYAGYSGWQQLTRAVEREGRLGLRSPPIRLLPFDPILRTDLVDLRVNAVRYALGSQTFIAGADLRLPWRLRGTLEGAIGLVSLECDRNIDPDCNLSPEVRRRQGRPIDEGNLWIVRGGPQLLWDRRDNALNPRRGMFVRLRGSVARGGAAALGQASRVPFSFLKLEGNITGYLPIWEATLAVSARAGLIDLWRSLVPIDQRFFLGGRDTLRGFVESTLIPADACVGPGPRPPGCAEQLVPSPGGPPLSRGGNAFGLLKSELRLPLSEVLAVGLFADLGNLWVNLAQARSLWPRLGVGAGLRYATPVGAMAFDLGLNPLPRRDLGEPWTQFHFSLGAF